MQAFTLPSKNGLTLHCGIWEVDNPRAIIQLVHGIAEHIGRYDHFAKYLNTQGFTVVADDHAGHGKTAPNKEDQDYFPHGWLGAVGDEYALYQRISEQFPKIPYIIFGHSMGSFLTRTFLYQYPNTTIKGAIICGTSWQNPMVLKMGMLCAKLEELRLSPKGKSQTLQT